MNEMLILWLVLLILFIGIEAATWGLPPSGLQGERLCALLRLRFRRLCLCR